MFQGISGVEGSEAFQRFHGCSKVFQRVSGDFSWFHGGILGSLKGVKERRRSIPGGLMGASKVFQKSFRDPRGLHGVSGVFHGISGAFQEISWKFQDVSRGG